MTLQEIFTKAYEGLRAQGFERAMSGRACVYRGKDGKKCAIGHCIPDEVYTIDIEGCSGILALETLKIPFKKEDSDAISMLQRIHDRSLNPSLMISRLHNFARTHNLEVPS